MEPAVKDFVVTLSTGGIGVQTDNYISLSQVASILNRRFYRAGLDWAVAGFEIISGGGTGEVAIWKIPETWVARNSWIKGYHVWSEMNQKALEESDSVKAKFTDFKVFMDADHHSAGLAANLLPNDASGATATPGEWEMSKVVNPDTTTPGTSDNFEIVWTGANFPGVGSSGLNAVSLIEGYAASRGLPDIQDPNTPGDATDASGATPENWMQSIFNEGTTQDSLVLSDLTTENDQAPYPFENDGTHIDTMYPGGANQMPGVQFFDAVRFTNTSIGNKMRIPGTNFPGGLIKISNLPLQYTLPNGDLTTAFSQLAMIVRLVPGSHRGYLAEPLLDV